MKKIKLLILSSITLLSCLSYQNKTCAIPIPNVYNIEQNNAQQLDIINTNIANNMQKINMLTHKCKEINNSIKTTEKQYVKLKKEFDKVEKNYMDICRMSYMYKTDLSLITVILSSSNLSEFYNRYIFINTILKSKHNTIKKYNIIKTDLENTKNILKNNKKNLQKQKLELEKTKKDLEIKKENFEKMLFHKNMLDINKRITNTQMLRNITLSRGNIDIRNNILTFASTFLGMPYKWGGSNPSESFDCSGLVQYSYGKFGYSLPRTAAMQQQIGIDIPLSKAKEGDLIFFGKPAHHVGIYIGNGYMLHAPHTNDFIKISPVKNPTNVKQIII